VRYVPPALLADMQADTTCIAFLWTIEMSNGKVIRGTEHDLDVILPGGTDSPDSPDKFAGTYYAISNVTGGDVASHTDMSVDNLEVTGAFPNAPGESPYTEVLDITVDEIEAGLLDMAPVTVLVCNWQTPAHGYFVVRTGYLGAITRTSDGKYTTEVRGLSQLLAQTVIRTFSSTCNVVQFGDVRCRFNVPAITISGHASAPSADLQSFSVDLTQASPRPPYLYTGGTLTFTSGANAGFSREAKTDPNFNGGVITFWEQFPNPIAEGDTFTLSPGCDRQPNTCMNVYNNFVHWRGYGIFVPGILALMAGPIVAGSNVAEL
jgi:uncharacterized phage protein (TIGR02218 family)